MAVETAPITLPMAVVDEKSLFITPPPIGEQSVVMGVSVCLSVCVFVCPRSYLRNSTPGLHQFFMHITCAQ